MKQTLASRLTTLMFRIGSLPLLQRLLCWRMFWQVDAYGWAYKGMKNPWFDGQKWVERN